MTDSRIVQGRVVRATGRTGVHGLRVQAWLSIGGSERLIGNALTRADGTFYFAVDPELASDPRGARAGVTLLDRDGRRVYQSSRPRPLRDGRATIEIELSPSQLPPDRARAALEPERELVPARAMIADVEAALGLIVDPSDPRYQGLRRAAMCPDPPFELFEQLATDAPRVLAGDRTAAQRFRETVELFQSDASDHSHLLGPLQLSSEAIVHSHENATTHPGEGPVVPLARLVPLMAAAAHLDPGNDDLLGSVLGQVCRIESFGFVHRAALAALRSPDGLQRFEGIVKIGGGECGPIDQPLPPPPRPKCDPSMAAYLDCARQVANRYRTPVPSYTITSVTPARACAGTSIVIRGSGFTDRPGGVVFNRRGGGDISVTPRSWADGSITVVVPSGATCGLGLRVYERTDDVCGRIMDVYRSAVLSADFLGSAADIRDFRVNGRSTDLCMTPDQTLHLSWEVCAADRIRVELTDASGSVLASRDSAAASGTLSFNLPPLSTTQRWTAHIHAEGSCSPASDDRRIAISIHKLPRLRVDGIEVSQSIQYYKANQHLSDVLDRGPDNGVRLVTGKAAWARVYVRSGQDPAWDNGQLAGVSGTLTVDRIVDGVATLVTTLNAQPPASVIAEADPTYATERGTLTSSLNFRLPRAQMHGRLRLTAHATAALPCGKSSAFGSTTVDVTLTQTLRVAGIAVGYNGPSSASAPASSPNVVFAPPTRGQLNQTLPYTLATYPVRASFRSRIAGTITLRVPLDDPRSCAGCCSTNWNTALSQVQAAATADGNRAGWLYYGLLATGIPLGVPGCGQNGGVGGGGVGNQQNMAHELGHQLGRQHTPCGNAGATDTAYPAYEPYDPAGSPTASIGEYGLDIRDGTLHPPTDKDFMSYCGPQWISLYGMQTFANNAGLNPSATPAAGAADGGGGSIDLTHAEARAKPHPVISLIGRVHGDASVELSSVAHIVAVPEVRGGVATDWIAELLGAKDELLASAKVHALQTAGGCGCGGHAGDALPRAFGFQALVPDVKGGKRLRLRHGDSVRFERAARAKRPWIERVRCRRRKDGKWELTWSCGFDAEAEAEVWIQWSNDRGKSWNALAVGVQTQRHVFDAALLPAGSVEFRVLAHDGFSTASAQTDAIRVPVRPPEVAILHPSGPEATLQGAELLLWGDAVDCHGEPLPDEQLEWRMDGKTVGTGPELLLSAAALASTLRARHELGLVARDRHGESRTSITLHTPRPRSKRG